jgi:hypothetical protein
LLWNECGNRVIGDKATALRMALGQCMSDNLPGAGKVIRFFPGLREDWLGVLTRAAKTK